MEHDGSRRFRFIQTGNDFAFFITARISGGRHDDADGGLRRPTQFDVRQTAVGDGAERLHQIAVETHENRLCLRIAETDVEFQNLRAVFRDHQSRVDDAAEIQTILLDALQERLQHLLVDDLPHRVRHDWRGRIGAHAARVRAEIAVQRALMVLRTRQRLDGLAVAQRDDGGLFADQAFLQQHAGSSLAECS